MLKWLLRRQIAAFERTWNYDASYIHEMMDADPRAMMAFGKVQGLTQYRKESRSRPIAPRGSLR